MLRTSTPSFPELSVCRLAGTDDRLVTVRHADGAAIMFRETRERDLEVWDATPSYPHNIATARCAAILYLARECSPRSF